MWSHYAASHTGICVGFATRLLKRTFGRIDYVEDFPVFYGPDLFGEEKHILNAAATKSIDWSYEKEWRTFANRGAKDIKQGAICEVICGCAMSEDDRAELTEMVAGLKNPPRLFHAQMSQMQYKLEIKPLE
jgi:hypothetical protein